jgi:transcriptional regulator with XRE-family HTH domain
MRRGPGNNGPADAVRKLGPEELFGRAVHFLRLGRGLRLSDLAARAGMSIGRLSGIENGKYAAWRGSADAVARALSFPDAQALLIAFYGDDYPPADRPPGAA